MFLEILCVIILNAVFSKTFALGVLMNLITQPIGPPPPATQANPFSSRSTANCQKYATVVWGTYRTICAYMRARVCVCVCAVL